MGIEFVILDAQPTPGGAWQRTWESLHAGGGRLGDLERTDGDQRDRYLVAALPPGGARARGLRRRAAAHRRIPHAAGGRGSPRDRGRGGNSAAQIAADLAYDTELTRVTRRPPRFLADDIDGRALFDAATARRRTLDEGRTDTGGVTSPGDIVAVPPVRAACDRGLLKATPMFTRLLPGGVEWADGTRAEADMIIWCTGFRPALSHLAPLKLRDTRGHILTAGTRAVAEPRLHLLGYGDLMAVGVADRRVTLFSKRHGSAVDTAEGVAPVVLHEPQPGSVRLRGPGRAGAALPVHGGSGGS
jgi:hypothetical protein